MFWPSEIVACILFTFGNRVPLMRGFNGIASFISIDEQLKYTDATIFFYAGYASWGVKTNSQMNSTQFNMKIYITQTYINMVTLNCQVV